MRDWDAISDRLGDETVPVVLEALGWLNWATSGYCRTRFFNDVLIRRDGGNQEVSPRGWIAEKGKERTLWDITRTGWLKREPRSPAFLGGGLVLRNGDPTAPLFRHPQKSRPQ